MSFDGSDDYLVIDDAEDIIGGRSEFTIDVSFNADAFPGYGALAAQWNGTNANEASFWLGTNSSGKLSYWEYNGSSHTHVDVGSFETGVDYDVQVVKDGSTVEFYIDGALVNTSTNFYETINQTTDGTGIQIGGRTSGGNDIQHFDGDISGFSVSSGGNTLIDLDFEGNDPLADKSGNGHDAAAHGDPTVVESGAGAANITTDEDVALVIDPAELLANDTDVDGDTLTISGVTATAATHGTVSLDADGNVVFTPEANYNGEASFEYTVSDGQGGEDTATASLNVSSVNDLPVVDVQSTATVDEDGSVTISYTATDIDSDVTVTASANNGEVTLNDNGTLTFTPNENYNGNDTITLTATDADGVVTTQDVAVTINAVNDAPVATDDGLSHAMSFDGSDDYLVIDDAEDIIGGRSEFTIDVSFNADAFPGYGALAAQWNGTNANEASFWLGTNSSGKLSYWEYNGSSHTHVDVGSFETGVDYDVQVVKDGSTVEFYIDGALVNTSTNFYETINQTTDGTGIQIGGRTSGGNDIQHFDGDISGFSVSSGGNTLIDLDFEGNDPLADKSGNGHDAAAHGDPTVVESGAGAANITTDEDVALVIDPAELLANDTDVDGDTLTISGVTATAATHGTVSLDADGNVVFTPEANYNGEASFEYTVSDGQGGSDSATATLNVASDGDDTEVILTQTPTDGADAIIMGDGDDTIDAGAGNDYINGQAGADTINAGEGDDTIVFDAADTVDGGAGFDTLAMTEAINIDFGSIASKINNIENINLSNNGADTIKLSASDVLEMTDGNNTLHITTTDAPGSDTLELNTEGADAEWSVEGTENGVTTFASNDDPTVTLEVDDTIHITDF